MNEQTLIDIEVSRQAALIKNQSVIKKFKNLFEEPIYDDEYNPKKITYKLIGHYALITSTVKEIRKVLNKYISRIIVQCGKTYFLTRFPENQETYKEFRRLLAVCGCQISTLLFVDQKSLRAFFKSTNKEIPKLWRDRIPLIKEDLSSIKYLNYTYTEKPFFPLFPFDTAKEFIESYTFSKPYDFYKFALRLHVASSSGLFNQSLINTVVANTKDIRKLLPSKVTLDKLIDNQAIYKVNKNLIFYYDIEHWKNLFYSYDINIGRNKRNQVIYIPLKLLPEVFKSCSFGINGLKYFLLIIYGLRIYKNPAVYYKPSYIIENANINIKKGKTHAKEVMERPLKYFKEIGVISSYGEIDLKSNAGIKIYIRKLHKWEPPNKNK